MCCKTKPSADFLRRLQFLNHNRRKVEICHARADKKFFDPREVSLNPVLRFQQSVCLHLKIAGPDGQVGLDVLLDGAFDGNELRIFHS